jgi:type VI secretion system protein VasI
MRLMILIIAALVGQIGSSFAQSLQQCASISTDADRLACYDDLAEAEVKPVTVASPGKWRVDIETSPVDDSKNVYLRLVGENGIASQYGQRSDLELWIACRENVTSAFIVFGGHFMSDLEGRGRVTYRIDSAKAQKQGFTESSDHKALGLWNGGTSIPWVKAMFGGNRMYVEATPFSESAVSDFMPIAGLEEAIKPLRESCAW